MRNLLEYPITREEIINCLNKLSEDLPKDLVGDIRPVLLAEAVKIIDENAMKVLVCGGRDFNDHQFVHRILDAKHLVSPISLVIHGGARGADYHAMVWADARHVPAIEFPAGWQEFGKAAGPIRNQQMLDEGQPDCVIAFPGGEGTADMVNRATKAGVPVHKIPQPQPTRLPSRHPNSARDGAPDLITVSRSGLAKALAAEIVEHFSGPFVPTEIRENEALSIACDGIHRALTG